MSPESPQRILDIVIPSYNRPAKLFALLETGLKLGLPDTYFVVIDDGSTVSEPIDGVGTMNTGEVCSHFKNAPIVYIRNAENMGLARSWIKYFGEYAHAKYVFSMVDKDVFVDKQPILNAVAQMERDASLCMVFIPLLQKDRANEALLLGFSYETMTGKEFISQYVNDVNLMHVGGYAIKRTKNIHDAGIPRNMQLTRYGLDDMFGIDIDLVFLLATMGNVGFEPNPHVKRSTLEGGTEKYPLTFAYTYYQYAKRAIDELRARDMISPEDARKYLGMWHLLILRGLVVSYQPQHGSELERGTSRIRKHLKVPIHFYVWREMRRYGVVPTMEIKLMMMMSLKLMLLYPFKRIQLAMKQTA